MDRRRRRLGMIIPSSNTVVETETAKLLPGDRSVSVHYARFRVTQISKDELSRRQFVFDALVAAAELLADAKVDLILWNGTAASWLGFQYDDSLIAAIETKTSCQATTAVQAVNQRLASIGAKRIGLVTPYVAALEGDIIANYREIGVDVIATARRDLTENTAYAEIGSAELSEMVRSVASSAPDAIVIMCTNIAGAGISTSLEQDIGIPVLDSVKVAVEHCLEHLNRLVSVPE